MSYDEQPDGDPHGECAAEINRLEAEAAALRTMLNVYTLGGWPDVDRLSKDLADMRQQITFQARTNAEQAKLLNEVIAERDGLMEALSCAESLFDRKWNGVVGSGCEFHWHPVGNWRHYTCKMTGETFAEAIAKAKP